jgi:O-antigen/teichoic acid export membrane protein
MHDRAELVTRVARNTLFVLFARGTDLVVALFTTMLIARYLGITDFGNFALVTAISLFLGPVADFGFERIIAREIARDKIIAGKYLGSAVIARLALSLLILVLVTIMLSFVIDWDPNVERAVYLSTFAQLFTSMGLLGVGTFRAFERMEYELVLNFFVNLLYLGLLVVVIVLDGGFILIFGARLIASMLQMILLLSVATRKFVKPVLSIDKKLLRYLFTEAAPLGIFAILLTATFRVDVFVLSYYKGPVDVSIFEAAHRIIMQFQVIPMSIVIALFPFFSVIATHSTDALKASYSRAFKIMFVISIPLPILITPLSGTVISVLYGVSFAPAAASLSILSWTLPFLFLILLQTFVMTAQGRQRFNTICAAIGFSVNFLLDLLLVPSYGFLGASYATLISYVLLFFLTYYFLAKSVGALRFRDYLPKPLLAAGTMGLAAYVLSGRGNALFQLASAFFVVVAYAAALYATKAFSIDEVLIVKRLFTKGGKRREQRLEEA